MKRTNSKDFAKKNNLKKNIWGSPYSTRETLGWVFRVGFGINHKNQGNITTLPQLFELNRDFNHQPKYKIAFIGDIMDTAGRSLKISNGIIDFIKECDFLVGNFEATITDKKKKFTSQRHIPQILDALAELFAPSQTFLSVSNNHAGDFGRIEYFNSISKVKSAGFHVFGWNDKPFIDLNEDIRIVSGTAWSNLKCDYVLELENSAKYLKENCSNILFPHWGYELELYPRLETISKAKVFIENAHFDAIIGHHSHCVQPISFISSDGVKKLISYGLGDFDIGIGLKKFQYGMILIAEIGKNPEGRLQISKINWKFIHSKLIGKDECVVDLVEKPSYLKNEWKF